MSAYIRVDESGHIHSCMEILEEDANFPEEEIWVQVGEIPFDLMSSDYMYRYDHDMGSISVTDKPLIPVMPYTIWDGVAGEWTDPRDLEDKKDDKWAEIKKARDAEEFSTFTWNSYTFQCDEVSQQRLMGAVLRAQIDPQQTVDWTLSDNTSRTFTATEIKQVGLSLAAHVDGCHVKARQLREQIVNATNETEINAVTWEDN